MEPALVAPFSRFGVSSLKCSAAAFRQVLLAGGAPPRTTAAALLVGGFVIAGAAVVLGKFADEDGGVTAGRQRERHAHPVRLDGGGEVIDVDEVVPPGAGEELAETVERLRGQPGVRQHLRLAPRLLARTGEHL